MNEKLLYINASIFFIIVISLLLPRKHVFNTFSVFSSFVLIYLSPLTTIALFLYSAITFLLAKLTIKNHRFFLLSLLFISLVFVVVQIHHLQSHAIVIIGIIYVACRQIHFYMETIKQRKILCSFLDYLKFQFYLPCLVAGPIHRVQPFLTEVKRRKFVTEQVSNGLERVVIGHAKVVLIANVLFVYIESILFKGELPIFYSTMLDWLKLYVMFSGFSDIAIGFSLMLGIKIEENFNYPFLSRNINEFWQRWHISLSTWCKDYVFVPITAASRSILLASFATMVIIGLWHEFSLRYVLWGFYHGLGIYTFQFLKTKNLLMTLPKPIAVAFTLLFVISSYPVTLFVSNYLTGFLK